MHLIRVLADDRRIHASAGEKHSPRHAVKACSNMDSLSIKSQRCIPTCSVPVTPGRAGFRNTLIASLADHACTT